MRGGQARCRSAEESNWFATVWWLLRATLPRLRICMPGLTSTRAAGLPPAAWAPMVTSCITERVRSGVVVAARDASAPADLHARVDFNESGWIAARRMDAHGHQLHT